MPTVTKGKGYFDQRRQVSQMQDAANGILEDSQSEYNYQINKKYQDFMQRAINDAKAFRSDLYYAYGDQPTYADYVRFANDWKLAKAFETQIGALNNDVNNLILENLKNMYMDSYNLNAWTLDEATPPNLDIEYRMPPDQVLNQMVAETWGDGVFSGLNASMAYDIQKNVMLSMIQGDSAQDLAKRIQGVIGDDGSGVTYQAKRIARTELLRSADLAKQDIFDQNQDVIDDEEWVTRALGSGRLCNNCLNRAGHTLTEIENGEMGNLGFPLDETEDGDDMFERSPGHPFCGCTTIPKLKSWQDLLPPELSKGMPEWDDYTMAIPSEQSGFMKVEPMPFGKWADTYLSDSERGNL